jgi:NAD(P)-dependent dehydrogenase (short-subunit alcohol dehydrogenase family)
MPSAFITGAASGLGRALATHLVGKRVSLTLVDVSTADLQDVVASCRERGSQAVAFPGDACTCMPSAFAKHTATYGGLNRL